MRVQTARTPLAALLAERIRSCGPVTFAEFMNECLYHPEHGYYSRVESQRFADYYTSPDVHPIFGRLLARQFVEMWQQLGRPATFWLVEAGAGAGRLARQILDFAARELPEFYSVLRYVAVERSAPRRAAQPSLLERHLAAARVVSADELPAEISAGCIFSNELLDALPVHRVICERGEPARPAGGLREIYVDLEGKEFRERVGPLTTSAVADYFSLQDVTLVEGQQAEAGLAACEWIEDAGRRLGRGFVLTVDYGHEARELYNERHLRGTLLAYRRHRASEDFFAEPGEQDLTAHVNFTALDLWSRRAGLERLGLVSQAHFLLALGRRNEFADLYDPNQTESERLRARLLLKNLIHPEGLGETFQVCVQQKNAGKSRLAGLEAF